MRHLQKSGIITLKALGSPIGSRTAQVKEQQLEETKFIAFFMGKKIDIDGKDLYDAKQKAITQLKVPKSKVGLLAVVSVESQRNQDFKFENVNEAKVIDIIDRFEHLKLPDIVYLNKKPYTGKTFVMNGYNGYTSSDTDGWVYDSNTRKPLTDKQGNILRATTHRGAKWDFKNGIRESVNEENPGLWANIRAKRERGEAPAPKNSQAYKDAVEAGKKINKEDIENVANGLPQTMGKQKSLKREALKSIVKEVMQEEAEYQKFFQKVLDKAGKSIPSMSDDEKKAFFNKVDSAWKGKQEGK
jgi:hypothetical protein